MHYLEPEDPLFPKHLRPFYAKLTLNDNGETKTYRIMKILPDIFLKILHGAQSEYAESARTEQNLNLLQYGQALLRQTHRVLNILACIVLHPIYVLDLNKTKWITKERSKYEISKFSKIVKKTSSGRKKNCVL